jgi:hypothetical protein
MTSYREFVEAVLQVALERATGPIWFGMPQIGAALGLEMGDWGDEEHRDLHLALDAACRDLDDRGLLDVTNEYRVAPTLEARRFRRHSVRELWPELRAGHLEPDEEAFLAKLHELSGIQHDGWAEARWILSSEVFAALGWDWDRGRSFNMLQVMKEGAFAWHRIPLSDEHRVRIAYAGAVRVEDEVGGALMEARDHLAIDRVRAAGCVAGVELERRLKALCASRTIAVTKKLPTIADYNDALKGKRVYAQPTWRKIQHLADLRNKCAHVLDSEPTASEGQELVEGVEEVLRALPVS